MSAQIIRCGQCHRRMRSRTGWNVTARAGVIVDYTCPQCQTVEQHVEAEINEATIDYQTGKSGLIFVRPK